MAVEECIANDILREFLVRNKTGVMRMLFGKEAWRTGWILIAVTWLVTYGIVSGINMRKK